VGRDDLSASVQLAQPQEKSMNTRLGRRAAVGLIGLMAAFPFAASAAGPQDVALAIKGYDPVAYFTNGRPVRGLPEFEYEWDEHVYHFASAQHREMFRADPVRYAPQFGNFCAMALAKGQLVVANPENWMISDGKLYVFGSSAPAGPALFQKDLAGNISKANKNRSMLPKMPPVHP
jgi:YHS domain-containing protein